MAAPSPSPNCNCLDYGIVSGFRERHAPFERWADFFRRRNGAGYHFGQLEDAIRRLQTAKDVATICTFRAADVRRLIGYDRVKVYRFAADGSGEVLAEDNGGRLPSYLGLHFPASDIPAQARALYILYPEGETPGIDYAPVPLIRSDPATIDLGQAMLRSVSPVHLEYLRNMKVGASMSISILRGGALWDLVA